HAHLFGQSLGFAVTAQNDFSAVHTGSAEESSRIFAVQTDAEHHNQAAGQVFTQKRACTRANDQNRLVILVGLHVDACTVAHIVTNENASSAHSVARRVAAPSMYHDLTGVHG